MFVPFNEMPADARIWIYPCSRTLSDAEVAAVKADVSAFVEEWLSHKRIVKGSGTVLHHRFILLSADEEDVDVSGCSIDSSVRFIKTVEASLGIGCFERTRVYFLNASGELDAVDFREIRSAAEEGRLNADTTIFNIQVSRVADMDGRWMIPLGDSPYARFLPVAK